MSTESDWFEDSYEDDADDVQQIIERAKGKAELLAEQQREREAAASKRAAAAPKPDAERHAERQRLEGEIASLKEQVTQYEGAIATNRTGDLMLERALLVEEVRGRMKALPFVGKSDEELSESVEPIEIAVEEAKEALSKVPANSARGRKARRELDELRLERDGLDVERHNRAQRASLVRERERAIRKNAVEHIKRERFAEVERLVGEQPGTRGEALQDLRFDLMKARANVNNLPTDEEVAAILPKIAAAYDQRIKEHAIQNSNLHQLLGGK